MILQKEWIKEIKISGFDLNAKFNTARMGNQTNTIIYVCYVLKTNKIKIKKVINNKIYLAI